MKTAISTILITLMIATVIYAQDSPQWHLPEGAKARLGKGRINQIAYSPDETILAAATSIGVWLYDVQTGKELQLLATEPVAVQSIAFSPDGTKLVSTGMDAPLSLWDVESGKLLRTFPIESSWSIQRMLHIVRMARPSQVTDKWTPSNSGIAIQARTSAHSQDRKRGVWLEEHRIQSGWQDFSDRMARRHNLSLGCQHRHNQAHPHRP